MYKNVLKIMRDNKGLSQTEAAKLLGISNASLSQYEAGRTMPQSEYMKKLANFYNIDEKTLYKSLITYMNENNSSYASMKASKRIRSSQKRKTAPKTKYKNLFYDLRKKKGLTQDEVGEKIGTTGVTIGTYESRRAYPQDDDLKKKVADFFGVDFDEAYRTKSELYYTKPKKTETEVKPIATKPTISTPATSTKTTTVINIDGLLERVYGKVDMADFKMIEELINLNKNV